MLNRCDSLQSHTFEIFNQYEKITCLYKRSYLLLTFVIPIKINTKDTIEILVCLERYNGINKLDLTIFITLSFEIIFKHKLLCNGFFIVGILFLKF